MTNFIDNTPLTAEELNNAFAQSAAVNEQTVTNIVTNALTAPGPIGSATPNTGTFTTILAQSSSATMTPFQVNSNPIYAGPSSENFNININASGSVSSGNGQIGVYQIVDAVDASALPGEAMIGLYIDHVLSAGSKGARSAFTSELTIFGNAASLANPWYAAGQFQTQSSANVGGTSSATVGNIICGSFQTVLNSGASWYAIAGGVELGVTISSGASAQFVNVLKVSSGSPVVGVQSYNGLVIGSSGPGPGFNIGLCFASAETTANPIATTGTMIGSQTANGASLDAAFGVDFSLWTFSTAFLKSKGFLVDGSGNTTVAALTTTPVTVATLPAAGVVGRRAFVTDATATIFGSVVAGGGSDKMPVFDNGTAWLIG